MLFIKESKTPQMIVTARHSLQNGENQRTVAVYISIIAFVTATAEWSSKIRIKLNGLKWNRN
jgi:hypothetical protein